MNFSDALITTGICIIIAGAAFTLVSSLKARRDSSEGTRKIPGGAAIDRSILLAWSGILLVEVGNIAFHRRPSGLYDVSALTWAATAGAVFLLGVAAGRLLLRLEWRRAMRIREE
jgi:hypothetical protein